MVVFKSSSQHDSSRRPDAAEKRRKDFFRSQLMKDRKKPQSSNSLFWDWTKDVKNSPHSPKKSG
jgi:hypothetical protein